MSIVQKTIPVSQEGENLRDAVMTLLVDIKGKKDVGVIASDSLLKVVKAVEGFSELAGDYAENRKAVFNSIGGFEADLIDALLPLPAAPAAPSA